MCQKQQCNRRSQGSSKRQRALKKTVLTLQPTAALSAWLNSMQRNTNLQQSARINMHKWSTSNKSSVSIRALTEV